MLMILYGATAGMGFKSREYLINKGFELVEKYYYAPNTPEVTTLYGKRNFVSKSEFLENTDSLFKYEIGGMTAGFNQQQISDAVCNKKNMLLTLSAKDIAFLAEIKRVYVDSVCLIYAYIDDETLKNIVSKLDGITLDEVNVRLKTGMDIKQCYIQYQSIFDNVVLYGGECSIFDYQSLYRQFGGIIGAETINNDVDLHYADVFISYTRKDVAIYEQICASLTKKGISVFDDRQLSVGTEWLSANEIAIQNAKVVIPIITDNSLSSEYVFHEICFALDCAEKMDH